MSTRTQVVIAGAGPFGCTAAKVPGFGRLLAEL